MEYKFFFGDFMDFARGSITQANKYLRRYEPLEIVLQTLFAIVSVFLTIRAFNALSGGFQVKTFVFKFVTSLPYLREIKKKKLQEAKKDIFKTVHGKLCKLGYRTCLPSMSSSVSEVLKVASSYHSSSAVSWKDGRMSGAVYPSNSGLNELLIEIQKMTLWSNPLHVDAFPAVRRMEAEVVRMCLTMFNGDSESCGTSLLQLTPFLPPAPRLAIFGSLVSQTSDDFWWDRKYNVGVPGLSQSRLQTWHQGA